MHSEDAGVRCPTCTEGALRLRGGTATRGRLELCHANVWGTVCDHSFTTVAAQVACAQLGYTPDGTEKKQKLPSQLLVIDLPPTSCSVTCML